MQPLLLSGQGKEKALAQLQLLSEEGDRKKKKKKSTISSADEQIWAEFAHVLALVSFQHSKT